MNLSVIKEVNTPLLSRKRVTLEGESDGTTPSRIQLVQSVADKVKANKDLVVVKHIYTRYGSKEIKIIANVYKDKKDMQRIEEKYLLDKHKVKEPEGEKEQ